MAKTSARKNPSSQPSTSGEANSRLWILRLLLIVATAIAYLPAWNGKQIWDDKAHITAPALRSLNGLKEIWFEPGATQQYYPVVHSAFWLEHKLWGDNVLPYHLVNILLHGFSAILLFQILRRLNVPGAWLAAALFALHPVQVETVAWISELKNTLSGVFCLSSALLYLQFDEKRRPALYGWSLALYLLGLMSKTAMAGLPGALLVVLWWQRGALSWKRDLRPLLPFFAVGLIGGLFTAWVERHFIGAQGAAFHFSLIERGLIAGRDFWFYLFKIVWPAELIFIYPRWNVSAAVWWQVLVPGRLASPARDSLAPARLGARAARRLPDLPGHAFSGARIHQRLPLHFFVRGGSLSISRLHRSIDPGGRRNFHRPGFIRARQIDPTPRPLRRAAPDSRSSDLAAMLSILRHRNALAHDDCPQSGRLDGAQQSGLRPAG